MKIGLKRFQRPFFPRPRGWKNAVPTGSKPPQKPEKLVGVSWPLEFQSGLSGGSFRGATGKDLIRMPQDWPKGINRIAPKNVPKGLQIRIAPRIAPKGLIGIAHKELPQRIQ